MFRTASKKSYDRTRILADARRAVKRGKHAKAIALYEQIRQAEPDNVDVLRRLALQRVHAGQRDEAWRDCRAAAEGLVKQGFREQAIGVCRDFATHVPDEPAVWLALSRLEFARNRAPDAVDVLLEGRRFFRSRRGRQKALILLREARRIDPTHFEANFDLSRLLIRSGARVPARRLLVELEHHVSGRELRRLRGRMFSLSPGPTTAWRWLSALVRGE